ncbi:SusD/RagB family nutrient-binding outer membrane lipoprotein [Flagellimonas nanhaiensis]|uniref:SusD/RagB family nutrient-binding outer membrane lipoprotein n=1 Tax=Flagellimonas nanhaiensis TaxID=2292706 RepID=A0A371JS98_9FLAO|nr:SusD/RagB family nutrient-binding outer membrane lipoprotein [Allomuricauda nanhaiensis]RDY60682.1 SusD/RagB family nutrient-binding outer membrane lipoprotein [Allomuricauda nanhaiensis]
MRNINKYIATAVLGTMLAMVSCETTELDLTQNPNALTPDQASADFFLSSIQEDFIRQFEGDADFDANDNWQSGGNTTGDGFFEIGMELSRVVNMSGRNYVSAYQGSDMDDEWINAYRGILADLRKMNPLAEEAGLTHHIGIGQFIEAFLMVSMVDFFGDVPYTEAITAEGEANFNPAVDSGASIYDASLALLDQAIANFNSTAAAEPTIDYYYAGDYEMWVKAANTLKMKIYMQRRLVDSSALASFNSILASGNYISDTSEDMIWSWSSGSASQPDTRHPRYGINYTDTGGGDYQSNWLMNLMDTSEDPRIRYYFYRQSPGVPGAPGVDPNEETLNCSLETPPQHYIDGGFTFCWLDNGYWGRDHGDADGIPPDGLLRAAYGVYPVGGQFDDDSFGEIALGSGSGGNGISNLLTSFGVDFMIAEAAMASGDVPGARAALLTAVEKSITKVQDFSASRFAGADASFAPTAGDVTSFVNAVGVAFDDADTSGKWDILGEQYFVAHFGNGVETYNFYRRTNFPTTLQPNLEPNPDVFIQSMYYPTNAVNNNSNISQKANQQQAVFWDDNGVPPAN